MDDEQPLLYSPAQTDNVVRQLRANGWPEHGAIKCPECGKRVRFKPGYTLEHEWMDIPPCDGCGRRPHAEIERGVGVTPD